MSHFDFWSTHLINTGWGHPALDALMIALTAVALPALLLQPAAWWRRGRRRDAGLLLATMVVAGLGSVALQAILGRPRPEAARMLIAAPPTPSFPSGHAAIAFAVATLVGLIERRRVGLWLALAAGIALSRVYVGHHHISDIAVGAAGGAALGAMSYGLFRAAPNPNRPRWAWLLWGQLALLFLATVGAYLGVTRVQALMIPGIDKVLHFILFGTLAFLVSGWLGRRHVTAVVGALLVLSTIEEALQGLSPARSFDLMDLACTLSGITVAGVAFVRLRWTKPNTVG